LHVCVCVFECERTHHLWARGKHGQGTQQPAVRECSLHHTAVDPLVVLEKTRFRWRTPRVLEIPFDLFGSQPGELSYRERAELQRGTGILRVDKVRSLLVFKLGILESVSQLWVLPHPRVAGCCVPAERQYVLLRQPQTQLGFGEVCC